MNHAILCVLGLAAIFVVCSSEPQWSGLTRAIPEASEQLGKRSQHNWAKVFGPTTASLEVDDKQTKAVHFEECRKLKKSGSIHAECEEDEIAVGCAGTGVHSCSVTQLFGARGCTVDKESCGHDFVMTPSENAIINAVCCKRDAVAVE